MISAITSAISRQLTEGIDGETLTRWQMQHLSLQSEVVSWFRAAQDALVGWADHLDPKIVQLKCVVRRHGSHDTQLSAQSLAMTRDSPALSPAWTGAIKWLIHRGVVIGAVTAS